MSELLLDTHIWLWLMNADEKLSKDARKMIQQALTKASVNVSMISVWELAMLEQKRRITLNMPYSEWVRNASELCGINLIPLSANILIESCNLPDVSHGDPADKMIIATARVERMDLMTKDLKILDYAKTKHIRVIAG